MNFLQLLFTTMEASVCILFVFGLFSSGFGQDVTESPTSSPWPKDRGLILTTYYSWADRYKGKLRHLQSYPGYENVTGEDAGYDDAITPDIPEMKYNNPDTNMRSISVDFWTKTVFMHDYYSSGMAFGTGFNEQLKDIKIDYMRIGVSRGNIQLAVDWLSHTVYWADTAFRWIVAAPGQNDKLKMGYHKIIVDKHLEAPTAIAVDPFKGLLFWSDVGVYPRIEYSNLDGSSRHILIANLTKNPSSLEVDTVEQRIYWIDKNVDAILTTTYSGQRIDKIRTLTRTILYDMALFRTVLYVSDIYDGYLYTLNRTLGPDKGKMEADIITFYPQDIYGIAVYGEETQPRTDKDHCAELNCDQMCLTTVMSAVCACSEGFRLDSSTGKCQKDEQAFTKAIVFANQTHICWVNVQILARSSFDHQCIFTVIKQSKTEDVPTPNKRRKRQDASPSTAAPVTSKATTTPPTTPPTKPATTPPTKPVTTPPTMPATTPPTTTPKPTTPAPTTPSTTVTTTVPVPTAAPGDVIKMFDMDMVNRVIFFATVDNTIYKRPIDLPIENDAKELIVKASGNISGLAYDAVDGKNLYWCESDTGTVWLLNTVDRSTKIVNDTVVNPRDIIVLLKERKLAMITGADGDMSIQTLTMDASELKNVIEGKNDIPAFTYDNEKQRIYYIYGSYIYYGTLDGDTDNYHSYGVNEDAYILFQYQNYISWVYRNESHVNLVNSRNQVTGVNVNIAYFDNSTIVDMKALDVNLQQTNVISPCAYGNGGCSQICITKYTNDVMTPVCECALGYTLEDKVNCTTKVVTDNFILVTDWTDEEIHQIGLDTNEINVVPGDKSAEYMGVFYNPENQKVIWAEYFEEIIYVGNLNGTDRKPLVDLGNSGYAYRFDMDMTTKNLYFTAYYDTFIGVITPNGTYRVLKDDFGWDSVLDIVVHPEKGWMYYTVDAYPTGYVGRSNMFGLNAVELISGENVSYPDGLAINFLTDRLYWSDADHDTIQDCNLDGEDCITIVNMTGTEQREEIRDLVTDGIYLYYSTYMKDHVVRIDLKNPGKRTEIGRHHALGRLDTIALYSSENQNVQRVNRACQANNGLGDCSTICIPIEDDKKACTCEEGVSLKPDGTGRICENIYQCKAVIEQRIKLISNVGKNITITLDNTCSRLLHDKCRYTCPNNYEPLLDNTLLTCTSAGWNKEFTTLCKEVRCPTTVENGKVNDACSREVGVKCQYDCNDGFVKTREMAVCTQTGKYHIPSVGLCTPFTCSDTIKNVLLDQNCDRTIGNSCKYTCAKFYTPNTKYPMAVCQDGGWSQASSDLCQESVCRDDSFQNGKVTGSCMKKIGEACMFECNQGYVNTTQMAVCKSDKIWHPKDSCTPYLCSDSIDNGVLSPGCERTVGSSCSYTCKKFYTPTVKKSQAVCQADGWTPSELCRESVCDDSSLTNGDVSGSCLKKIGDACAFECKPGYVNTTHLAFCKNDKMWHPKDACTAYTCSDTIENGVLDQGCARNVGGVCSYTCNKHYNATRMNATCTADGWSPASTALCEAVACSSTIPNGKISESCDLTVGSTCDYTCTVGYTATEVHPNVTCKRTGKWVTDNLCIVPPAKESKLSVPAVATGFSLLAVIVIVLVIAVLCLVRRKTSSSSYASFDDSGTAIENPGYRQRMSFPDIKTDDPSYSQVDVSQMKPISTTSFNENVTNIDDGKL
ncbi:prolow-density lipoprotein receptor-related protein 1-like [Mercenaria mercenaria]|uniref:prolow-density lipoprotein receptor-related protein 1-like n=1 Tax=Mercenaria mercenaria TaxID=6596 RepID=UPI00234E9627|nr:prolow-density lipoprotein receptor-related protein 1-like [Mercenaria mercenaria]XP_053402380.1 prolow-density lipoprotein receptor-related protein 1-like [Mercenaria mercenaria]XP_053402381.1 prolow-density lipoprotein receptor-related protein 1-like [Mercenaria mercenaria]XP_053402382.1 prolow-density lipoprotein receptor-related protein 1-like [Mercenaria mercenaria]